jgi:glycosyltransferase involved in cell wall biosynthesis
MTGMTNPNPKVSIGLPVYNGERFLAETIESVLAQTFTDFELVISDNGSSDRTKEISLGYVSQDPRVRFVRSEVNQGASWNYRRVFELSRGKYFRWAPADDLFAPESLAECVATLDANQDAVLCYPKTLLINEAKEVIGTYEDDLDFQSSDPVDRFYKAIRRNKLINAIYGLIRSDDLRCTTLMGNYPGADVTLIAELSLHGRFLEIPRPLFLRRMHGASSTSMTTMESVQEFFDPKTKGKLFLYLWRHLMQHAASIRRAPRSFTEKVHLYGVLLRWMISCRDQFARELIEAAGRIIYGRSSTPIQQGDPLVVKAKDVHAEGKTS